MSLAAATEKRKEYSCIMFMKRLKWLLQWCVIHTFPGTKEEKEKLLREISLEK